MRFFYKNLKKRLQNKYFTYINNQKSAVLPFFIIHTQARRRLVMRLHAPVLKAI